MFIANILQYYFLYLLLLYTFPLIENGDFMEDRGNDYFVLKKEGKYYYEPYLNYDNEYEEIIE